MTTAFRFIIASLSVLAVALVTGAAAQDARTDPTVFVKAAALGELTQIELAKLAQSKTQDATIRAFAERMLKEHGAIDAELGALARRKGLDVPTSLVYEDEQTVKQGAARSGAAFDAWYAGLMRSEHQKAIALFEAATTMQDADFAAFAKKTLPALTEGQRLAATLGPAAKH
jgi:putative membrane protein